jgi:uncharacterized cupin superfamily protein
MERRAAKILTANEIANGARWYAQRLNERSRFLGSELARVTGLSRLGVSWAMLPAGCDSFAYHAHDVQEEWMYMLSGRAVALIDGRETEVQAGDFIGFPAPQVPHLLRNAGKDDVTYLMGGERPAMDVLHYPALGKRYLLRGENGRAAFYRLDAPEHPFGELDDGGGDQADG